MPPDAAVSSVQGCRMISRLFQVRMLASVTSRTVDRPRSFEQDVSRAHDCGASSSPTERAGIAMTAREPHTAAPRTGGVSSTERTSPGRRVARTTDPQSTERRKLSEGVHRQR
jgi:hypothetical protein